MTSEPKTYGIYNKRILDVRTLNDLFYPIKMFVPKSFSDLMSTLVLLKLALNGSGSPPHDARLV